jgi:hypothetical protein
MKKLIGLGCVALVLCFVSGCGGKSAEAIYKDQTKLYNEYADAVEKKDDAKAKEIQKKIDENEKALADLKLSEADKKKLADDEEFKKAAIRYAGAKLGSGLKDAMKGLFDKDKKDKK